MNEDQLFYFENMSLSQIISHMVKWFEYDEVTLGTRYRPDVASRLWFSISIQKGDKSYYIDAQRMELVKARLIALLDRHGVRKSYLEKLNKS